MPDLAHRRGKSNFCCPIAYQIIEKKRINVSRFECDLRSCLIIYFLAEITNVIKTNIFVDFCHTNAQMNSIKFRIRISQRFQIALFKRQISPKQRTAYEFLIEFFFCCSFLWNYFDFGSIRRIRSHPVRMHFVCA